MSTLHTKIKLDNKKIRSISEIHIASSVQYLDLSKNKITDFSGLHKYQNLIELNMDGNPVLSFNGFPKLTRLKKLSLIDIPISKLKNFKELALIAAGTQIEMINGESITAKDRANSVSYGNIETNYNLISKGWLPAKPNQFVSPNSIETKQNLSMSGNSLISDSTSSISSPKYDFKRRNDNISQKLIDIQEKDPISVRAVRIMRQNGISNKGIGQFLCDYFDDYDETNEIDTEKLELKEKLKENGKIIDDLARKRHELTSRNRTL